MSPRMMIWIGAAGIALPVLFVGWELMRDFRRIHISSRQSQSEDHLHNLTIALLVYEGDSGVLLSAASTTAPTAAGDLSSTTDLHGWQTLLLPYVEQKPLYGRIDQSLPWDDPVNEPPLREWVGLYANPSIAATPAYAGLAPTHYSANQHVLTSVPLKLSDVTDGESNTLFSGEINARFPPWGQPRNVRDPADGLHTSPRSFGGPWSDRSTQFSFLDGRVRALNPDIDPAVLKALATPAGGETVTPP